MLQGVELVIEFPYRSNPQKIPNPPRTNLIKDAAAAGCTVLDGLGMLVNQGVIGIKYWTDVDVDPAVMRQKLESIFGS